MEAANLDLPTKVYISDLLLWKKFHLLIFLFRTPWQRTHCQSHMAQAGQIQTPNSVPGFPLKELILHRLPSITQAHSNSWAPRSLSCKATYLYNKELLSGQVKKPAQNTLLVHYRSSLKQRVFFIGSLSDHVCKILWAKGGNLLHKILLWSAWTNMTLPPPSATVRVSAYLPTHTNIKLKKLKTLPITY